MTRVDSNCSTLFHGGVNRDGFGSGWKAFTAVVFFLVLVFDSPAFAWGNKGHEYVCEIAYRHLTPESRAKIHLILGSTNGDRSFVDMCGDGARLHQSVDLGEYAVPAKGPIVQASQDLAIFDFKECGPALRHCSDLVTEKTLATLVSESSSQAEKFYSLQHISLWVGEIHQPLNGSYRDDRKDEPVEVTGVCETARNFQDVWDHCLVEYMFEIYGRTRVEDLHPEISRPFVATVTAVPRQIWLRESSLLILRSSTKFCFVKQNTCSLRHRNRGADNIDRLLVIDRDYLETHHGIVHLLLVTAGVRLAFLLNEHLAIKSD